jgi:exosome complex component RRP42
VELLEETEPLPTNGVVTSLTFAKFKDKILYDTNLLEDRGKDARFSLAITDKGVICSMQKGDSGVFYENEIELMLDKGSELVTSLLELLESSSGESETKEMFRFEF